MMTRSDVTDQEVVDFYISSMEDIEDLSSDEELTCLQTDSVSKKYFQMKSD